MQVLDAQNAYEGTLPVANIYLVPILQVMCACSHITSENLVAWGTDELEIVRSHVLSVAKDVLTDGDRLAKQFYRECKHLRDLLGDLIAELTSGRIEYSTDESQLDSWDWWRTQCRLCSDLSKLLGETFTPPAAFENASDMEEGDMGSRHVKH